MTEDRVIILGAGIIGLSLALELRLRGHDVLVLERGHATAQASSAAAGMLAANDPENPSQLHALSHLSIQLYPDFLRRITSLSGIDIPIHTSLTLQRLELSSPQTDLQPKVESLPLRSYLPSASQSAGHFVSLPEQSLDPRQLAASLLAAVRKANVDLREDVTVLSIEEQAEKSTIHTAQGTLHARTIVDCTGAWSGTTSGLPIQPVKGQMLRILMPPGILDSANHGRIVVRTPEFYVVPRLNGTALIGATVEDVGFDTVVDPQKLISLQQSAAELLPSIADQPIVESWAGLRPGTPDHLPLLGSLPNRTHQYIAAGHFRNGILLAPATAHVMADVIEGKIPSIDLSPFTPARFTKHTADRTH